MLNENTIEALTERFTNRFSVYNTKVLEKLGNVIKQFEKLTPTQAYQLAQKLKYSSTLTDLINELSQISGKSIQEVELILEEIAKKNIAFADVFYKARGIDTPIYEQNIALQNIVKSVAGISGTEFVNIARTTGFRLLGANNKPLLLNIQQTYNEVIDRCVYATLTGQDTFQNQMRDTIKQLSNSGVRKIEYESGYSRRLDTSVRQNIQDTIRQITIESQKQFGKEFNSDGVEISVHLNPAPDHSLVQGKQFSNEEFNKFQNNQDALSYDGQLFTSDFNGKDRRSIGEFNCYHYIFSIILGISKPIYNNEQLNKIIKDNNKGVEIDNKKYTIYEVTQIQRQLETEIRKTKDLQIIANSSGNKELIKESQNKISKLTKKYKEISKIADIPTKMQRMSVSGYKRVSTK